MDVLLSNKQHYLSQANMLFYPSNCREVLLVFPHTSSRAPGGWNNGVRHSNDVLQARAKVKNNKYNDVYGLARRLHLPS